MSIRFLADADLNVAIVTGTRLREPAIDFLSAVEADLEGVGDPEVLGFAASQRRILVSHDKKTLPGHFARFLAEELWSPGIFLAAQSVPVREAIESLVLIWSASHPSEWENQIIWLPSIGCHGFRR